MNSTPVLSKEDYMYLMKRYGYCVSYEEVKNMTYKDAEQYIITVPKFYPQQTT